MPIYEYRCPECEEIFESLIQPWEKTHGGVACKHCNAIGCEKLISVPAGYSINGDNSASTSPRARNTAEANRQMAKRERMHDLHQKSWGMDLKLDKAPTPGNKGGTLR